MRRRLSRGTVLRIALQESNTDIAFATVVMDRLMKRRGLLILLASATGIASVLLVGQLYAVAL